MVQGLPAVKWTPENNAKLLAAIVTLHPGALDNKKLASVFGPHVPIAAIQYRLSTARKEGAALGITSDGSIPAVATKVIKRAPATSNKNGKGRKSVGGLLSNAASDYESVAECEEETEQGATPPESDSRDNAATTPKRSAKLQKTIGGRVTKARVSPRKSMKKDYKTLDDPFVAMNAGTDADGEKLFDTEKTESEDSYGTDGEFGKAAMEATIKMEEAI